MIFVFTRLPDCAHTVTRDAETYKMEVAWHRDAHLDAATRLIELTERQWSEGDEEGCRATAELALVLRHRAGWHAQMEMHLAGFGEQPGAPPPVPDADTLCRTSTTGRSQ